MDGRGPIEVALSTDLRGSPYYFSLWDVHTGAQLVVFKGNKGNPIARCLKLIDKDYFITATDNMLQIWSIYNKKCQDQKLFLPGRPSVLCTSPCGNYLIAGIAEMIYIWQLKSGNLLAHTQRHYQTVTVLRMNQDGTFLFSGGEDGIVLVWPFADLISNTHNTGALNLEPGTTNVGVNEPRFTWQHHDGPVTDIHVTHGGRCITTSVDKTVNIYNISNGKRLYCVTGWPSPIWSVAMNKNETRIFLGGQDGNIYEISVSALGTCQINNRNDGEQQRKPVFVGHKDKVTHIIVSIDGTMLITASLDSTCKVWDIHQGKMIRDVKHQAPLANLTSLIVPDAFSLTSITQAQVKPPMIVRPLKRNLYKLPRDSCLSKGDLFEEANTTIIGTKNKIQQFVPTQSIEQKVSPIKAAEQALPLTNGYQKVSPSQTANPPIEPANDQLKSRFRELYLLSSEKIFRDVALESLQPFKEIADRITKTNPELVRTEKRRVKKNMKKRKSRASEDGVDTKKLVNGVSKKARKEPSLFV